MKGVFTTWEKKVTGLAAMREPPSDLDGGTGRSVHWWKQCDPEDFVDTLLTDLQDSSDRAQKCLAKDKRATIKAAIAALNRCAEKRELRRLIRSVLKKKSPPSDVTSVVLDGSIVTDPRRIHEYLTQGWSTAFSQSDTVLPVALGLEPQGTQQNPLPAADRWEEFLTHPEKLVEAFAPAPGEPGIPLELRKAIADAMAHVPGAAEAAKAIDDEFKKPFSRPEFDNMIKSSRSGAPGLTGLTYQMLQLLPDSGREDFFNLLQGMWRDHHVPAFWTFKALVGIPKASCPIVTDPAKDLRPIGLLEVTRKIWTRLVIRRIARVLTGNNVIQPNHCGGLPNQGTDSALLQALNMLETALEFDLPAGKHANDKECFLDFSTWDAKKAFDSVGNHCQYIGWRRLGVPRHIAEWLLRLDVEGVFVIQSTWAKTQLEELRMVQPNDTKHHDLIRSLGFCPQKGFTQGDVKSPLSWVCYFDILMLALNRCDPNSYPKVPVERSVVTAALPFAFVDDLSSFTCLRAHTQQLADLVSAAHAIFGTEAATHKFRALTTQPTGGSITVHDNRWNPTVVPFSGPLTDVTLLGMGFNLGYTWAKQIQAATHLVRSYLKILRSSRVDPFAKCDVIVSKIILELAYKGIVSAWPMDFVESLSQTISGLLRDALGLPVTYPYALIHSAVAGLGITRFSTYVLSNRERCLLRCLAGPGAGAAAARGTYNRAFRHGIENTGLGPGDASSSSDRPLERRYYASSLVEAGLQRGFTLHRRGTDTPLRHVGARWQEISDQLQNWLREYDIQFLEELVDPSSGSLLEWTQDPKLSEDEVLRDELKKLVEPPFGVHMEIPLPITRGHQLLFEGGPPAFYGGRNFGLPWPTHWAVGHSPPPRQTSRPCY